VRIWLLRKVLLKKESIFSKPPEAAAVTLTQKTTALFLREADRLKLLSESFTVQTSRRILKAESETGVMRISSGR